VVTSLVKKKISRGKAVEILLRSNYIEDTESVLLGFEVTEFTE